MFEGFVGIRLWDGQIVEDILFSILAGLLLLFAFSARLHTKSFLKMFRCIGFLGREGFTTEMSVYYNKYFNSFMTFQALLLASLWVFLEAHQRGYTHELTHGKIGLLILATFLLIGAYYLCRRIVYHVLIYIFADAAYEAQWRLNYNSIIGVWGISLYIPVAWQGFVGSFYYLSTGLFLILYILSHFAIIYKSVRLFHTKKFDLFYLSLYLCAHEILPLFIMYKGFIYLYNFIEKSALWH